MFRISYLNSFLAWAKQLRHVKCTYEFSTLGRSEIAVADVLVSINVWYIIYDQVCEISQMKQISEAWYLLKFYKNKFKRVVIDKKIQSIFSLKELTIFFKDLDHFLIHIGSGVNSKNIVDTQFFIYRILCDPRYLLICYCNYFLKSYYNSKKVKLFSINLTLEQIVKLSEELESKCYNPHPIKRFFGSNVYGSIKLFSLIPMRDKLIQQALKILLEVVFKPFSFKMFFETTKNHLFLQHIKDKWKGVTWFIKSEFIQIFDFKNCTFFLSVISHHLNDYWVVSLINKFWNCGYIFFENLYDGDYYYNSVLHLQDFMLNLLFYDIFFRELDKFVEFRIHKYLTMKNSLNLLNKEYLWYHNKLYYVRNLNCILLGIAGKKELMHAVLVCLSKYISCSLGIDLKFNIFIKYSEKNIFFLNYYLNKNYQFCISTNINIFQEFSKFQLQFNIPIMKLFKQYVEFGFFRINRLGKRIKFVGKCQDKWLAFASDWEVVYRYNLIIQNIENYYFIFARKIFFKFWHALKRSAALTLAHRYKKQSANWAFKKFGIDLTVRCSKDSRKVILLYIPTERTNFYKRCLTNFSPDSVFFPILSDFSLETSVEKLRCCIPNCLLEATEWYFSSREEKVDKTAEILWKNSLFFVKQLFLCKIHYIWICSGKYDGFSLQKLLKVNFNKS